MTKSGPKKPPAKRSTRAPIQAAKAAEETFVEALATIPNAKGAVTRAALKAYPNQNRRSAGVTGSRLLSKPSVQERIEARRARARESADITRQEVVGLLAQMTRASLSDVLDENGDLDWAKAQARGVDHLIKEVTVTERHSTRRQRIGSSNKYRTVTNKRVTTKYKIHDPQKAMDLLAEIVGWKRQAMKNPVDSARESFAIMRARPDYQDIPDPELARLAQEAHGLPPSAIPDILAGTVKG